MIADTETAMNAVERTQHYTELEAEPQTCAGGGGDGGALIVRDNSVEFRDYSMRYRAGLPLVLEGTSVGAPISNTSSVGCIGISLAARR